MNQCSAEQAACQENCRNSIDWWKVLQRQRCQRDCNAQYAECYAALVADTEEQSSQLSMQYGDTLRTVIIVIVAVLLIVVLIFLWMKYRKQ